MISCERCCDRFRRDDCKKLSSEGEGLCLRLRVFLASGSCASSGPAFPNSSTITVTSALLTLSSQALMVDSQEIVLRDGEGEERVAVLTGLETSFGL